MSSASNPGQIFNRQKRMIAGMQPIKKRCWGYEMIVKEPMDFKIAIVLCRDRDIRKKVDGSKDQIERHPD